MIDRKQTTGQWGGPKLLLLDNDLQQKHDLTYISPPRLGRAFLSKSWGENPGCKSARIARVACGSFPSSDPHGVEGFDYRMENDTRERK